MIDYEDKKLRQLERISLQLSHTNTLLFFILGVIVLKASGLAW